MKVKGWQIAIVVIGLLVGGWSLVSSLMAPGEVQINHIIHAVDVESGVVFRIDTLKHPVVIPAPNPATGKFSLLRVKKDEAGHWVVTGRDLSQLRQLAPDIVNKVVDPSSGELKDGTVAPVDYTK